MKSRRWLRILLKSLALTVLLLGIIVGSIWWYFSPTVHSAPGIVYTQRSGDDLTFDVLRPDKPNGLGVILMVSGSWKSSKGPVDTILVAPLIRRGYTVFPLRHQSQPQSTVMEIFRDIQYGIRFIRHHATDYGVDPNRLAVTGGSSGGHLCLMAATRGNRGNPTAEDPVARESSAIQAAACFFPVTDLLNLGKSTENPGDGGPPKSYVKAFGPDSTNMVAWKVIGRDMSPIYHITTNLPPILLIHGDADTLVPIEQSQWFVERAREKGMEVILVPRSGKKHGWLSMLWDIRKIALWFDQCLKP